MSETLSAPQPLRDTHDVSTFDCGQQPLDEWLRLRARRGEGRFSRTYVACQEAKVIAYYALAVGSVERAMAPGKLRRNAPDPVPIAIIARLAVDRHYGRRGLGASLLADAFRRILAAADHVGIAAVLVHAKDDVALDFYRACAEFLAYPADSRTLFLPIETIAAAVTM